ncbi:MAG: molybdate ABC transporter substrate-binding protein [Micrococcales bacterium 73-13]|nr:MAG: molybdate ABC transporter substrate-binding protein [Micrococcales bacterium 73-13]
MRTIRALAVVAAVTAAAALTACASPAPAPSASPTADPDVPETSALGGELTVSAAASLKAAFDEIAAAFEAANPGVDVLPIEYDGSSTLATQIIEGKPVDVFASADEGNLQKVVDAGLITSTPVLFATNTLVIAVPEGNPGGVTSLADLADPALRVVLCDAEVPCGKAATKLLGLDGVAVAPVSFEQNVTAVLTKVAAGEADAGLVYATDVAGRTDVESMVPDRAGEVVNRYPIAALDAAPNAAAAAAFAAFVTGPQGQAILGKLGFGRP